MAQNSSLLKQTVAILLIMLILPKISHSQTTEKTPIRFDLLGYYVAMDYGDSQFKEKGSMTGVYSYFGYGLNHLLETELDYTSIDYQWIDDIKQWDATVAYTNFAKPNYKLRVGGHYISSNDDVTSGVITAFAGINRYVYNQWNAQLDGYFSTYPDFKELNVLQFTPRLGFYFGNRITSTFYAQTRGYYIRLSEPMTYTKPDPMGGLFWSEVKYTDQDLFSVEESISYYWRKWTFSVSGWMGEQMFAVKNDGFVVNNVEELHTGGYGASVAYVAHNSSVTLGFGATLVEERDIIDPDNAHDVTFTKFSIGIGHTF